MWYKFRYKSIGERLLEKFNTHTRAYLRKERRINKKGPILYDATKLAQMHRAFLDLNTSVDHFQNPALSQFSHQN